MLIKLISYTTYIYYKMSSFFISILWTLVQYCSIYSALAMEILQSCTKPSIPVIYDSIYDILHAAISLEACITS